ncbi:GTPase [Azoarcus communis]|uniref:GTPase n=1 Tax=Parazoarcus communis SWub3 = DSM 12120 TaxID=1121029 RepID=A0A323V0K1_9RHOO|nr:dynamin family protein [Parazoarcus communis]NMG47806.1 GTPase [Parazoarcus communis]NMG69562.1 GTPase [Parazoarcus communis SWub3 = DSM 12120]PZA17500.1 GTPase [Azoarcus communis] [Parazoarcus communis SWub3 = DSM 12120]
MTLAEQFSAYGRWRGGAIDAVTKLRNWLSRNDVGDAQADLRLQYLVDRLREDKLTIAFVAEFSRGKSELINAIFFSDYGDRILPSSAGRTTMCPTELQWSPGARPELRLLPIATRALQAPVSELKRTPEAWTVEPLAADSAGELQTALARVGEVERVTQDEAERLGFKVDPKGEEGLKPGADGLVEVPSWRHAVIQFPHPLLEQGLVVLDTPGLNAIGAEPELTLSLLPNAHAVLFILAADTGVTQSDLAVWRDYVTNGQSRQKGRLVVLNKIDGLWDGLREESQIQAELDRQVRTVAETLEVDEGAVFPVSAQKGLVARINGDAALLERSRLGELERALSEDLLPTKQQIVRDNTVGETADLVQQTRALLEARLVGVREQLRELTDLRGKNQNVIEYMMRKIRVEKDEFEQGLQKYYAVRSVFSNLTNNLLAHLGMDALRDETRRTREAMLESTFSKGLRGAMEGFFEHLRGNLAQSSAEIGEITNMLDSMYKRFSVEHGLKLTSPEAFSTQRYEAELDRLEKAFNRQINTTLTLVTTEKHALTQKFFETIAVQARRTFELANRDVEQWLRAVMSPLETQVREYQLQLKRRLESVKRIHQATDTLEDRVDELKQAEAGVLSLITELEQMQAAIGQALGLQVEAVSAQSMAA